MRNQPSLPDVVLFGIQGAGKGVQGQKLEEKYGYQPFVMGNVLREVKSQGGALGAEVARYMDAGELVPKEVTMSAAEAYLRSLDDHPVNFDGFPRNESQMAPFEELMKTRGKVFTCINLVVPRQEVIARIQERARKEGRKDDQDMRVVLRRLNNFEAETLPVIHQYNMQGKVKHIDGRQSVEEVAAEIQAHIETFVMQNVA